MNYGKSREFQEFQEFGESGESEELRMLDITVARR
jgi:hypothetical protein